MLELAERCEKATGPEKQVDWEYPLDADIFETVKGPLWDKLYHQGALPCGAPDETCREYARQRAPRYTASIDAAMTLVPEGWVESYQRRFDGRTTATCYRGGSGTLVDAEAATSALALCAAALRARAHLPTTEDDNADQRL